DLLRLRVWRCFRAGHVLVDRSQARQVELRETRPDAVGIFRARRADAERAPELIAAGLEQERSVEPEAHLRSDGHQDEIDHLLAADRIVERVDDLLHARELLEMIDERLLEPLLARLVDEIVNELARLSAPAPEGEDEVADVELVAAFPAQAEEPTGRRFAHFRDDRGRQADETRARCEPLE